MLRCSAPRLTALSIVLIRVRCSTLIVDPGHYSVYHCDGLVARLKVLLDREQELSNLMERASEGGGGFFCLGATLAMLS